MVRDYRKQTAKSSNKCKTLTNYKISDYVCCFVGRACPRHVFISLEEVGHKALVKGKYLVSEDLCGRFLANRKNEITFDFIVFNESVFNIKAKLKIFFGLAIRV